MSPCILDTRNIGSVHYCHGGRTGAPRICLSHCERLVENNTHCTQLARERLALIMVCVALRATCVENSPTPLGGAGVLSSLSAGEKGALPHGKGPWRRAACGWCGFGQVKQPRVGAVGYSLPRLACFGMRVGSGVCEGAVGPRIQESGSVCHL